MIYKNRIAENRIQSLLKIFPIVTLTGARQTGKSTLLKNIFHEKWKYVSLDNRSELEKINNDPDLFIRDINSNIIIDEAQKAPELFHSIKAVVDIGASNKFILSGSANFLLLKQITETLAGRSGLVELFTYSIGEQYGLKSNQILQKILNATSIQQILNLKPVHVSDDDIFNHMLYGGFPKINEFKISKDKTSWFEAYRTTYIERDLRELSQVANIMEFQQFYKILSFQIGNILNLSNLASDIGVSSQTCKKYLSILQSSYQYYLLPSFHYNIKKRLIKSPKIYAYDPGLINYFLDYHNLEELKNSGRFGSIFENLVLLEIIKQASVLDRKPNLFFYRTSNGAEVDILIESGRKIIPVEVKSSIKLDAFDVRGIESFMDNINNYSVPYGIIIYRGDSIYRVRKNIVAIPVSMFY